MSAFDGSSGVDSADIINVPNIGFSSFQFFPDQFNYTQNPLDPTLPAFNQTLELGLNWIRLQADLGQLFGKPVLFTGFGVVTQNNTPFFVPFNETMPPFGPNSQMPVNATQPFNVTDDQRDQLYEQWIEAAIHAGIQGVFPYQWTQNNLTTQPGTAISPNVNETSQSPLSTTEGQSPNDGYGGLDQTTEDTLGSVAASAQATASDNS
ncbi:hypothetical protein C0992_000158 [Termitomyces sp. T32_za158]|nr:hypothetical protein C0992_000158 [Termitomyces sp. T32_za158]